MAVMTADALALLLILASVLAGLWVSRRPGLGWASPPVVALLLVVLLANLGVMPGSSRSAIPGLLAGPFLSAAIFLLLLQVDLRALRTVGRPLLLAFLAGCAAVTAGALIATALPPIAQAVGPRTADVAGMFTGTYTGGSVNFNTLAASFGLARDGLVYLGATAVDNVYTALWLVACGVAAGRLRAAAPADAAPASAGDPPPPLTLAELCAALLLTVAAVAGAGLLAQWLPLLHPLLWVTVLALLAAQTRLSALGRRCETAAILLLYLFIASLGADVVLASLGQALGMLAGMAAMVAVILLVHGAVMAAIWRHGRVDPAGLVVASQAAIGGPPTAIAMAEVLGRRDLRVPAALLGLLGYAIGTWLGLAVAALAPG